MTNMRYQINAELFEQPIVSIEDRAFLYGDGCFTTARLKQGKICLLHRHLQRMEFACQKLMLNCDIDRIKRDIELFVHALEDTACGVLKILISRGGGQRGYAISEHIADIYLYFYPDMTTLVMPSHIQKVGLMPEPLGITLAQLRGIKTLNRLEQVMLKADTMRLGWQDALCFDMEDNLVEGISSNCFVYLDKQWLTPDLALSGINGIMRQEILMRMKHYQIPHQVRMISREEIMHIDAAFFCNALHPMQIIDQLDICDQIRALHQDRCVQLFKTLELSELV